MRIILSDTQWYAEKVKALKQGDENLDFLYSYWFERNLKKSPNLENIRNNKPEGSKFYLDSGVFSARKKNIFLSNQELIDYYHKNSDVVDYVFNNDMGTPQEQLENFRTMKSAGVPVIPIWHFEMPIDFIELFCQEAGFISIGGVTNFNVNAGIPREDVLMLFYETLYKLNLEKQVKTHILGTESFNILNKFPVYSADSSKIVISTIYGRISRLFKKEMNVDTLHPRLDTLEILKDDDPREYIEEYGISKGLTPMQVREKRALTSIKTRFKFQRIMTELWKQRGVVWDD